MADKLKTLETSRGFTYSYRAHPAKGNKPTLLLLHGFPDDATEWTGLIEGHLLPGGFGVVAPNLLGYTGTSKPTDPAAYKFRKMVQDIVDILDAESLDKVIVLGHDWGSSFAQRFYNLAPGRVSGLAIANVGYRKPTNEQFDLDAVLSLSTKRFGYGTFWYWKLFTTPQGPRILGEHLDSLFSLAHPADTRIWLDTFCKEDGLEGFLKADKQTEVQPYATAEMRQRWNARLARDGFEAPCCWYRAVVEGHQVGEADESNQVVQVPSLFIGYSDDYICRPEMNDATLLPHLTTVTLTGGHWGLYANPKAFGDTVVGWVDSISA